MTQEARQATIRWLADQGVRDPSEISSEDFVRVRGLLSSDRPAFGILWSLIMFERQQAQGLLNNTDLSTSAGAVAAAKLQGIIKCVDTIRETVLNVADPIGEGSDSENRKVAGDSFNG